MCWTIFLYGGCWSSWLCLCPIHLLYFSTFYYMLFSYNDRAIKYSFNAECLDKSTYISHDHVHSWVFFTFFLYILLRMIIFHWHKPFFQYSIPIGDVKKSKVIYMASHVSTTTHTSTCIWLDEDIFVFIIPCEYKLSALVLYELVDLFRLFDKKIVLRWNIFFLLSSL